MLPHHQPSSRPVSEGPHNLVSAMGDDSDARDESLPYGVCRDWIAFVSSPGIRVITAITLGETMFRNRDYGSQLKDFSNLRWGAISPTDIDGILEFQNRLFIIIETKYQDSPLPTGQRLCLERLCDAIQSDTKTCVLILTSHESNGDIDMGLTIVRRYRENGNWHESPEMTLREVIEIMRRKYLGRV